MVNGSFSAAATFHNGCPSVTQDVICNSCQLTSVIRPNPADCIPHIFGKVVKLHEEVTVIILVENGMSAIL